MPATIIVGAQWGDEGKGRVADWLAGEADIVGRFAGGDNAGHTVAIGDEVFKLHLVPSGILNDGVVCVMGNGTVINPVNLLDEMDALAARGVDVSPGRLLISNRAHIVTPAHIALDGANEKARGEAALGTTLRGIGPAYLDKAGRCGIRAGLMLEDEAFADAIYEAIERANETLRGQGMEPIDAQETAMRYIEAAKRLQPHLCEASDYINQRLEAGARLVCEGAQGTMLDLDHGDYPFVTSSSPTSGGALTGLGFGPLYVDRVVGVTKCYATRVGSGPMPTELEGPLADKLRGSGAQFWDEYGTTTGRMRRCGWLDSVILRYAVRVNGFTELFMTKLDILSGFEELKIAVAYEIDGKRVEHPSSIASVLAGAQPIYETLPGWQEDIRGVRQAADLPQAARDYIQRVGTLCGIPVRTVSVGPARDQIVFLG